ncbi:MAG: hypothetical protein IPJ85_11785 [Flavobacteriales bacterium]|nr:hypothetical protein [Flavobacteriales bacterium]
MEKITIRAFRAVDEPELCRIYAEEHARVLTDIGVSTVVKYDDAWIKDSETIVFVALHERLGMVGGIRLQRARPDVPMPMEIALEAIEPELKPVLEQLADAGNAELGALWNAHRFAGKGVPFLLIAAAVATSSQVNLNHMVCFVAEYIAPYCSAVGFRNIPSVGRQGEFDYPLAGMKSHVMVIPDIRSIVLAGVQLRHRILSMRMRPKQTHFETPKRETMQVEYDLLLDPASQSYRALEVTFRRFAA